MICAMGAVACLASFNLQWSRELPVQRSHWEQDLFGDLATPAAPLSQKASGVEGSQPLPSPVESLPEEPILVEVLPHPMTKTHAAPLEHQPAGSQARFIQPVRHHQPGDAPTVWLSGGIEMLSDDPTPASQSDTRYFPDAHRE